MLKDWEEALSTPIGMQRWAQAGSAVLKLMGALFVLALLLCVSCFGCGFGIGCLVG